jgi:phosphoglycolate phosphatase-like HAD superfamily hydrolase
MHLVVFDIDGTLVQTNHIDEICFVQAVMDVLSIAGINTDWSTYAHVTDSGILNEIIQSRHARFPDQAEIDKIQQRFCCLLEEAFITQPKAFKSVEGGPATLHQLAGEADQALALATGGWELSARKKLRWGGYQAEEIVLATASDVCNRDGIMLLAEQRSRARYGVTEYESVTYVGDGLWDYTAAAGLGWGFIGIATGSQEKSLRELGASNVLSGYKPAEFIQLIRCLQQT